MRVASDRDGTKPRFMTRRFRPRSKRAQSASCVSCRHPDNDTCRRRRGSVRGGGVVVVVSREVMVPALGREGEAAVQNDRSEFGRAAKEVLDQSTGGYAVAVS